MARPLRIDIEPRLHHVTSRDGERRVMVRHDADCQRWLDSFDRVTDRCGLVCLRLGACNKRF